MGVSIVVIPDCHAHPEYDNTRAGHLGRYILETKPDIVLHLGDLADFPSLSSYDKGTKGFEGRRYLYDCEAAIDFQEQLWGPVEGYNEMQRRNRKATYVPRTIYCGGNHEARAYKVVNCSAELDGVIDVRTDIRLDRYWSEQYAFKEIVNVEGFAVSHFLPSGVLGSPIGGTNSASRILTIGMTSAIVGHSHLKDFAERTNFLGKKLQAIVAGCFVHPEMIRRPESWAQNTAHLWWNGIVHLEGVQDGAASKITFIDQDRLN